MDTPQGNTPQGNIPTPQPTPPPLKDPVVVRDRSGARPGWLWVALAILVALVIWGTHGRRRAQPPRTAAVQPEQVPAAPAGQVANNDTPTGDGVQILTSTNRVALVGRPFVIHNVPVTATASNRILWIGANNITPMLVVLTPAAANASNANIARGSRIDVIGVVARAPSADQAKQTWSLNDDDVNQLEQQGAYVQATQEQSATQNGQP